MTENPPQSDEPPPVRLVDTDAPTPIAIDFESFFTEHHRPIAKALAMTLRDDQLAADATAEAMTRAYARWNDVATYNNPAGWIFRVGLNWARSRRRKLVREVLHLGISDRPAPPTPEVDPTLDAALAELSRDQRDVVVLRYLLDWSEFQTAEALQIAPGTVKSRLSRALAKLAILLEDSRDA